MLRASGDDFDVDEFLLDCELEPNRIFRKGTPRFPASQPDGPVLKSSGLNFVVSDADFSELDIQMQDALAFLSEHKEFVAKLRDYPGVESLGIDFGAEIHPPGWYSFHFTCDLLLAIGSLGIELELSVYPVQEEDEDES